MTFYDFWWPLVFIGGTFLVVEIVAAANHKKGDTLSEWAWKVFVFPRHMNHRLSRFIFGGFWGALTMHFFLSTSVVPVALFGALMLVPIYKYYKAL